MIKTADDFISLINSENQNDYREAGITRASTKVWIDVINNHPEIKVWVARNRTIPKEIIYILSKDKDPIVREAISSKYPLEPDVYLLLSKDPDEGVRARLIYNKCLPAFILKEMADNDDSEFVRNKAKMKCKEKWG